MSRAKKYPLYRLSQWLDTSDEAMSCQDVRFVFGIEAKASAFDCWRHCCEHGKAILFREKKQAEDRIMELRRNES